MATKTINSTAFMTRADIARELGVSYATATRIFAIADKLDTDQLGPYRVERRVRRRTVESVVQTQESDSTTR